MQGKKDRLEDDSGTNKANPKRHKPVKKTDSVSGRSRWLESRWLANPVAYLGTGPFSVLLTFIAFIGRAIIETITLSFKLAVLSLPFGLIDLPNFALKAVSFILASLGVLVPYGLATIFTGNLLWDSLEKWIGSPKNLFNSIYNAISTLGGNLNLEVGAATGASAYFILPILSNYDVHNGIWKAIKTRTTKDFNAIRTGTYFTLNLFDGFIKGTVGLLSVFEYVGTGAVYGAKHGLGGFLLGAAHGLIRTVGLFFRTPYLSMSNKEFDSYEDKLGLSALRSQDLELLKHRDWSWENPKRSPKAPEKEVSRKVIRHAPRNSWSDNEEVVPKRRTKKTRKPVSPGVHNSQDSDDNQSDSHSRKRGSDSSVSPRTKIRPASPTYREVNKDEPRVETPTVAIAPENPRPLERKRTLSAEALPGRNSSSLFSTRNSSPSGFTPKSSIDDEDGARYDSRSGSPSSSGN